MMNSHAYVNNLAAVVVSALVAAFTAFRKVVVIVTVIRTASLHTPANILLCSLACGDFLVAVLPHPLLVAFLLSSNARVDCCLFEKLFKVHMISMTLALGSLVQVCVMCWDRFKATSNPLRYRSVVSKKKITVITVLAWVGSFCCIILAAVISDDAKSVLGSLQLAAIVSFCTVFQIRTSRVM